MMKIIDNDQVDQPHRINFRSYSHLRQQLSGRNPVIVIHSDSETESESETESISVGCPRSVRDRLRGKLEPKLRDQMRREIEPQLREQIHREMEPQLRNRIRQELEPQLREQIRREITQRLALQIHRELEPQLREQIRGEILPTRHTIEDEIREADEQTAWIDFLLHMIDDREVDITLDAAIAICDICISPCMNRRPIALSCGHIFCGKCIQEWAFLNRVCPKCRAEIRFSRSVFKIYPTLEAV